MTKQTAKKIEVTIKVLVSPGQIVSEPVKVLVEIRDESTAAVLD